jgi:hypothetical protein
MNWWRSAGWTLGTTFVGDRSTRSSSSAWSPSQNGLGSQFFISAVMNANCVSTEGQYPRATSSSHLVGAFSLRRRGITHYISAHWYRPPDEFVQAVTNCPEMRSVEYGHALATNGGRKLAQDFDPHWDDEFRDALSPPESCAIGGCMFLQ